MVRLYEGKPGSESIVVYPIVSEERVEDLSQIFAKIPGSKVREVFRAGKTVWTEENSAAFLSVDRDCKIYIGSGLNSRMLGKSSTYELPASDTVARRFTNTLNNEFFALFSPYQVIFLYILLVI